MGCLKIIEFLKNVNKKTKVFLVLNLLFWLFYIILQIWITVTYRKSLPIALNLFDFIVLIAYFLISIYSFKKFIVLGDTKEKLQNAEDYNKSLKDMNDNVRCFKHDYNNTVTIISGFLKNNDLSGLKNYFYQLEKDCKSVNNLGILDPNVINNPRYISFDKF